VDHSTLGVRISSVPAGSSYCEVFVTKWSDEALEAPANAQMVGCTGIVLFNTSDFNTSLTPGKLSSFKVYAFENSGSVICETSDADFTVPDFKCQEQLEFRRPDSVSISARVPGVINGVGSCSVLLSGFNKYVVEDRGIIEAGQCDSEIVIESDRINISMQTSSIVNFTYSYSFDGVQTKCSSETNSLIIAAPSCYQKLEVFEIVGQSVFLSIAEPRPLEGSCWLILLSCGGIPPLSSSPELIIPSCKKPVEVSFQTIQALLPAARPGQSCTFTWRYSYGSSSCASPNTITTPPLLGRCGLIEPLKSAGSVTVSPSIDTQLSHGACMVALLGCDGRSLVPPVIRAVSSCEATELISFSSLDSEFVSVDSTCQLQMRQISSTDTSVYACDSGPLSFTASTTPSWTATDGRVSLSLLSADCIEASWDPVDNAGGSPILCYLVWRQDGSERWYLVQDCGQSSPGSRRYLSCGYTRGVGVKFKVYAMNRNGLSNLFITSEMFRIEHFLSVPHSTIIEPSGPGPYTSATFPLLLVQAMTSELEIDTETTSRIFVAQLINETAVDQLTGTVLEAVSNDTFIFTGVLGHDPTLPLGQYQLHENVDFIPIGTYSLVVSSLEQGGLRAQYWTNAFFQGLPAYDVKDTAIDFKWTTRAIINDTETGLTLFDLVSIRWTGFVKPLYSEPLTISFETNQYMRVWFQNEVVVDSWTTTCPTGICEFTREVENTLFYNIRMDYYVSRGFAQEFGGDIRLSWKSYSQHREIIPSRYLYKSMYLDFQKIEIEPAAISVEKTEVIPPKSPVTAGEYFSIFIRAKDRFGQSRLNSTPDVFTCTLSNDVTALTELSIPAVISNGTGLYEILTRLFIAGSYRITIAHIDGAIVPTSGLNVTVIPSIAQDVVKSSITVQERKIANESIFVSAALQDAYGNILDGSVQASNMRVAIKWDFDLGSLIRLGPNGNDYRNRTGTYGTTFDSNGTLWNDSSRLFTVFVKTPLAGLYNEVVLSVANSQSLLSSWNVESQSLVSPNNSVILTRPFPPSNLVAGESFSVEVQLRDIYKNCIDDKTALPITGLWISSPVRIKLSTSVEKECLPKPGFIGIFVCSLTPIVAGPAVLTITVNGVQAQVIHETTLQAGPWEVIVSATTIDASKTLVTGLFESYQVSNVANGQLRLYLFDRFSNIIQSLCGYVPSISVKFLKADSSLAVSVDPFTFVYEDDGSINIPFFSSSPSASTGPWTLNVTFEAVAVPIPSPFVEFLSGSGVADQSHCSTVASSTAGSEFNITCDIRDWLGNTLDKPSGLYLEMHAVQMPNNYVWYGQYSDLAGQYIATGNLTLAGQYSIEPNLGQPGGLLAQYYADTFFSNQITPEWFVDDSLEHIWNGSMVVGTPSVAALSAKWSGLIVPPNDFTVRFFVKARGGLRFRLGKALVIDQPSSKNLIDTFVDHTFLSKKPLEIDVEYIASTSARVSITWQFPDIDGGDGFPIPPSALLAPRPITINNPTITVKQSMISSSSMLTALTYDSFTNRAVEIFTIQALDPYGNKVPDLPPCAPGVSGTAPDCLFAIFLQQPDGTPSPEMVFLGDGVYSVKFTFATPGRKYVHVQLVNGPSLSDRSELSGSPFAITVIST
jgi:hypothetical protein